MPSYEQNAYYNPANVGVELVAEWETTEPSYDFDTVILLRKLDDGTLWLAHDSGCSCPTPFEDFDFPEDFDPARSMADVEAFVKEHESSYSPLSPADFLAAAREAFRLAAAVSKTEKKEG